jgi:leucyl-tRNA synthetase
MEYTNQLSVSYSSKLVSAEKWKNSLNQLLILMSPITPHMSEELWEQLGNAFSIHLQAWPKFDEALAEEDQITLVIQVNGKLRDRILAPVGVIESDATALALDSEKVKAHIAGKQMRKIIFVPGRLVNIVAT